MWGGILHRPAPFDGHVLYVHITSKQTTHLSENENKTILDGAWGECGVFYCPHSVRTPSVSPSIYPTHYTRMNICEDTFCFINISHTLYTYAYMRGHLLSQHQYIPLSIDVTIYLCVCACFVRQRVPRDERMVCFTPKLKLAHNKCVLSHHSPPSLSLSLSLLVLHLPLWVLEAPYCGTGR